MSVGFDLYRMLRAGMPAEWTQGERLVALVIADSVSDRTRTGYIPVEQLCEETGYTQKSLSDVLCRLAKHGFEMRIPHGYGKDGRPVFASRGHATDFCVPAILPPRKARSTPDLTAPEPVDNADGKARPSPDLTTERSGPDRQRPGPDGERPGPDRTPTPNNLQNPNKQVVAVITTPVEGSLACGQPVNHDLTTSNGHKPAAEIAWSPKGKHARQEIK